MNKRVLDRLPDHFAPVFVSAADPALITADIAAGVSGVAVQGKIPNDFIDALPNLEIIANFGVGYDGVDAEHAAKRGVVVTNTPDVLTEEVADTAIGLLINTVRQLPAAEQWLRQGRWAREGAFALSPLTLRGRTVGLYGLGRIGLAIARRLESFGLAIAYHTRTPRPGLLYRHFSTLKAMAEAVDTIIVIVPSTEATHRTVNAVFENEPYVPDALLALPNVSVLPHVGSASQATRNAMADLVVDNLIAWFETGAALTPVDETPFTRKTA
jgi:lactate dehydrogenase-like 2-hydroxyacid dehydrogenase